MKSTLKNSISTAVIIILCFTISTFPVIGQRGQIKTDSRILYHDGPVMTGTTDVYLIWYGNWSGNTAPGILIDLASHLGASPYFRINTTYPDSLGETPNGALIYAGSVYDQYSQGPTLTDEKLQLVVSSMITGGWLPLDTTGIYLVIAPPDVTDLRADGVTGFCTRSVPPHHGQAPVMGVPVKYGFIGNADRCPSIFDGRFVGSDGVRRHAPNGNFGADVAASTMAQLLSVIVTSPRGTSAPTGGWYDRYGLENADKCIGKFGPTYVSANGGLANMRLGTRDYLIQQNWVNDRRGRCALSYP